MLVALTVRSFGLVDAKVGEERRRTARATSSTTSTSRTDPDRGTMQADVAQGSRQRREGVGDDEPHVEGCRGAGRHTLGVQLVNNDDSPLDPPATDTVEITVGG